MDFGNDKNNLGILQFKENVPLDNKIDTEKNKNNEFLYSLIPQIIYQSNPINANCEVSDGNIVHSIKEKSYTKDFRALYNENFIKQIKFVPNNKDLVLITNKNDIMIKSIDLNRLLSLSNEKNSTEIRSDNHDDELEFSNLIFKENNHIYDFEILHDKNSFKDEDYLKNVIICSKDNPIRILDGNKKNEILKTYIIRNQVEEIINPVCLKIDQFDLSLFAGGNKFIAKIDLVKDKIEKFQLKNEKNIYEKSVYSCFEFNSNSQFYITGTYSKKIFLVDNRTNIPFDSILCHQNGINSLKFLDNQINFISGARRDNTVNIWDIRNLKIPIANFYRHGDTNQKLEIEIDKFEKYLFLANKDGTLFIYDLKNLNTDSYECYFYENYFNEAVSSICYDRFNDILATSNGTRHFPNIIDKDFETSELDENKRKDDPYEEIDEIKDDPYLPSNLKLWKFHLK